MKKWVAVELLAVAALLVFAVCVCACGPLSAFSQQPVTEATTQATEPTEQTTQATTEPTEETTQATEETYPPMPEITWATFPDRELTAKHAFVYDCQKEEFTYLMGDPDEPIWPASITKLFSVYVALQYLEPQWELVAGDILDRIPEDASVAKLEKGDICTVEMLIEGMLLPSGNDAAYLIATEAGRQIANDPELSVDNALDAFVGEMNRQAALLGMSGTYFENPDGYHDDHHYTTFRDLVTVAKLTMENEMVMEFMSIPKATVKPVYGHEKEWINTNLLVNPETVYYCPYAIGMKTGQTDPAGSCLLSAFDVDGRRFIIGVFGSPLFNDKLEDTLQLFNEQVILK